MGVDGGEDYASDDKVDVSCCGTSYKGTKEKGASMLRSMSCICSNSTIVVCEFHDCPHPIFFESNVRSIVGL